MRKFRKWAMIAACAVLLVCVSIGATVAYLTSQSTVTNTFTVGNVAITMDETKVSEDGAAVANADRVTSNAYKLLPGHTYTKDPIGAFSVAAAISNVKVCSAGRAFPLRFLRTGSFSST